MTNGLRLGLGGAPLGNLFDRIPEDVAVATVQAAWDAGIRHYDNAPHYGAGLSEHRMGAVLRLQPRDSYALSSKVGRLLEAAITRSGMLMITLQRRGFEMMLMFRGKLMRSRTRLDTARTVERRVIDVVDDGPVVDVGDMNTTHVHGRAVVEK